MYNQEITQEELIDMGYDSWEAKRLFFECPMLEVIEIDGWEYIIEFEDGIAVINECFS